MVRDFTKSMLSFSWALSVFGVQQITRMLSPSTAAESFDKVTEATRKEFDNAAAASFHAGDNLQRGLVDLTFSLLSPEGLAPNTWMKFGTDVAQQTAAMIGQAIPGAMSGQCKQSTGWGPVPSSDK
jgi:hypothetical protein